MTSHFSFQLGRRVGWFLRVALLLGVFLGVVGLKYRLIDSHGSDLPFYDQWEAEGDLLFRPYLAGGLTAVPFTHAHNEHRIVPTLVWALALFELNDRQWDARLQMAANAGLHALVAVFIVVLAWPLTGARGAVGFAVPVVWLTSSAASWENTLSGFQSQFYFLLLFSLLHLTLALGTRPKSLAWWMAPLAGFCAVWSMGSGVLSSAAVIGVILLRVARDRRLEPVVGWFLALHVGLFAWGRWLAVDVPNTDVLKASGPGQWLEAWLHQLAWPVMTEGFPWFFWLGLIPPLLLLVRFFQRKIDHGWPLVLLGASAWCVAQTMAIAYARGGHGYGFSSRYADLSALSVLINGLTLSYLATVMAEQRARWAALGGLALLLVATVIGVRDVVHREYDTFVNRLPEANAARIKTVRDWLILKDAVFFKKAPWQELPYSDPYYLSKVLAHPEIQAILPASVRPPPLFDPRWPAIAGFALEVTAAAPPGPAPLGLKVWRAAEPGAAHFESQPFSANHALVSLYVSAQAGASIEVSLRNETEAKIEPLEQRPAYAEGWKRVNFHVPVGRYRLVMEKSGAGGMAFTEPQTDTVLSRWVVAGVREGNFLVGIAASLWLAAWGVSVRAPRHATIAARA